MPSADAESRMRSLRGQGWPWSIFEPGGDLSRRGGLGPSLTGGLPQNRADEAHFPAGLTCELTTLRPQVTARLELSASSRRVRGAESISRKNTGLSPRGAPANCAATHELCDLKETTCPLWSQGKAGTWVRALVGSSAPVPCLLAAGCPTTGDLAPWPRPADPTHQAAW